MGLPIYSLLNFHFKDSYFVSRRAFSFLSFLSFFFLSAYPGNGLTLEFKSPAVLSASGIVRKPKGGSCSPKGRPQNENLARQRESESWGQAPLTHGGGRSQTQELYSSWCSQLLKVTGSVASYKLDLPRASPPQSLHLGKRENHTDSSGMKLLLGWPGGSVS